MKNKIYFFIGLSLTFILFSCPPDDDGLTSIPEVDRAIPVSYTHLTLPTSDLV